MPKLDEKFVEILAVFGENAGLVFDVLKVFDVRLKVLEVGVARRAAPPVVDVEGVVVRGEEIPFVRS